MEFLEGAFLLIDFCGCFLEILAVVIDLSAGASTYRLAQKKKAHQQVLVWPVVVLIVLGVVMTGLVLTKWTVPR